MPQLLAAAHRRGALRPLLDKLPGVYAEAFVLRYIEAVPRAEIERRTGASAGVITHRVDEASRRLNAMLDLPVQVSKDDAFLIYRARRR